MITKIQLNRYFSHIAIYLILHLVFAIAFGSMFSNYEIPKENEGDNFLYLCSTIAFIYNIIACAVSILGLILIEMLIKKSNIANEISKKVLMIIRVCVICSQLIFLFTCIMTGVAYSKRSTCSQSSEPLLNLCLAYSIIGIWYVITAILYLSSERCCLKNIFKRKSRENTPPRNII